MDNIYGQTEQERNSIVQIPNGYAEKAGNTLYSWLGSLWRGLHNGDKMIRGLHAARGIRVAQLYLDILESAKLQDRNGAPVFHRELWHPIVVRLSKKNTAQENMLKIGIDGEVGPQPDGSAYGEGTVFSIGKLANFKDYVTYPVDADIAGGALSIVDNIVNPTVSMERGKDYEIRNNSIIFHKDNDPLGGGSGFDKYDIPGILDEDGNEVPDMEAVLWSSDVLIDKNYVSDHISYALGADAPSSDVVKRILNAAWSSTASGLTPELVRTLMAAMLNIPVIQHERETVLDIYVEKDDDGNDVARVVKTDLGSYRISLKAKLRKAVCSGSDLRRGDLLDESVRIYPFLNNVTTHEVVVRPEVDRYSDWVIHPDGLPEGGYYVDASTIVYSGEEWQAMVIDPLGDSFQFYSELGYDSEDALEVKFYSDLISGAYFSITRRIIHEDPIYRVDADAGTDFSVPLTMDIPSVTVPSGMIRARTEYGVYAMWDMEVVKQDKDGRLYFDVGGRESDVKAFWEDIWKNANETGADMEKILGPAGTKVSPAEFFLRNLVGANTLFVVVDRGQVDDASMMRNPMFFDMLSAVVPSAIRLFMVERRQNGDDMAQMDEADEASSLAAALPMAVDVAEHSGELVSMRFFRPPPAHVRGKREEEVHEDS